MDEEGRHTNHLGRWGPYEDKENSETSSENRRDRESPEVLYNPRFMKMKKGEEVGRVLLLTTLQ